MGKIMLCLGLHFMLGLWNKSQKCESKQDLEIIYVLL